MTGLAVPPGLILIAGAVLLAALRGRPRAAAALVLPLLTLWTVWLPPAPPPALYFLDHQLVPFRSDALSRLFATVFAITAFAGALFALNQPSRTELPATFVYAGSAIGVVMAGDLITLFVFWETMAIASTFVLWSAASEAARRAGMRYILMHLLGGVLLMAGIAGHAIETGTVAFASMTLDGISAWLILAGFLVNAGAPPVSAWLPDAYPEASWSGMVVLSAFTTKTAVYVLLRGFPGADILITIGLFMVFYGIVYALLESDMRRILAYLIVNQVGFMLVGGGIGTEMAINGAAAHAFTDIICMALLVMSAGAVMLMTEGRRQCSELGGLVKTMPYTAAMAVIGALAISDVPLTSGFVSKSMINQAAADEHLALVWFLLTAANAGVFLTAGLKFPWLVFFRPHAGLRPGRPPLNLMLAMGLFAFLSIAVGVYPASLYAMLPHPVDYIPYTTAHVVTILQLLLFAGLGFFLLLPLVRRAPGVTLDLDWVYRRALPRALSAVASAAHRYREALAGSITSLLAGILRHYERHHGPHGILATSWPTGSMALWAAALLGACLLLFYA